MELVKPINSTLLSKIKKLEGISFLTIQESNYQKDLVLNQIFSNFENKEIIRIKQDDITLKNLESISVNMYEISMLSPIKIYVIENIENIKTEVQKKLLELVNNIPEYVIIILTAKSLNKTNQIYKYYQKNDLIINNEVKNDSLINWIQDEFKTIGLLKYPQNLPSLVLEASENNIDNIKEILDYLSIYIKDSTITAKEFEKLFPSKATISDFKILDPIYSANYLEYMTFLKQILKNKNEFLIITIFLKSFSKLLEIRYYLEQKLSKNEIASQTNMQEWLVTKNLNIVRNYSKLELEKCLNYILKAEAKLKDKNLGVLSVFEELFFNLAPQKLQKQKAS